jgi:hypothetical protein
MIKQSNWLILSHGFNMDGRAASQTITDKIPFLMNEGINPVILSAVTGAKDLKIPHYQILPFAGAGLRFDLRHYLRQRIKNKLFYKILITALGLTLLPFIALEKLLFGLQSQASWSITALIKSLFLIKKHQIDLIYSTGGAYSAHLTGLWLKRITNLPWIIEIHDPMIKPNIALQTRDQKFQASLEKKICRHGDLVWWFTDGALSSALKRNPDLGNKGLMIIPGATPPSIRGRYSRQKHLNISHFGSLSTTRSLTPFLEALATLIRSGKITDDLIKLNIFGGNLDQESKATIKKHHLEKIVVEHGRLEFNENENLTGREQVIVKMQEADCLLLMHGDIPECSEYIPSKLYEYFWTRRPIFGITHNNQQLDNLIIERNGVLAHTKDIQSICQGIEKLHELWLLNNLPVNSKTIGVDQAVKKIILACKEKSLIK